MKFDIEEGKKSGVYFSGTSGSGKTTAAKKVIQALMEAGITCYIFDPSQAWVKDSPIKNVMVVQQVPTILDFPEGTSYVFDISRLKVEEQKEVVSDFCKTIWTFQVNKPDTERKWMFVFFEEAQIYLQQNSMRSKSAAEVMRLITVGRNFKIRYGLITQFPSTIDKLPVKMTKQRYFGYTDEKNDKDYIRSFLGEECEKLKELKLGEFIYSYGGKMEHVQFPDFKDSTPPSFENSSSVGSSTTVDTTEKTSKLKDVMWIVFIILFIIFIAYVWTHTTTKYVHSVVPLLFRLLNL